MERPRPVRRRTCRRVALVHPVEALEDAALVLRRDADARCPATDTTAPCRPCSPTLTSTLPPSTVILDGVVTEVIDDLRTASLPDASDGLACRLHRRAIATCFSAAALVQRASAASCEPACSGRPARAAVSSPSSSWDRRMMSLDQRDKALPLLFGCGRRSGGRPPASPCRFPSSSALPMMALQRRFELVRHVRREFAARLRPAKSRARSCRNASNTAPTDRAACDSMRLTSSCQIRVRRAPRAALHCAPRPCARSDSTGSCRGCGRWSGSPARRSSRLRMPKSVFRRRVDTQHRALFIRAAQALRACSLVICDKFRPCWLLKFVRICSSICKCWWLMRPSSGASSS